MTNPLERVVTICFCPVEANTLTNCDDEILVSLHPMDTWVGHVSTGMFPAQSGVEHTWTKI